MSGRDGINARARPAPGSARPAPAHPPRGPGAALIAGGGDDRNEAATGWRLRPAVPGDADACAAVFNAWVDATKWMPRVHTPHAVARHYREHVLGVCEVTVAAPAPGGRVGGFLAVDGEGLVAGFYLAPEARGRGVGTRLLEAAKGRRPEGLTLWTFVANEGARRFYARQGFVEIGRTAGENEEGLADVLLAWKPA